MNDRETVLFFCSTCKRARGFAHRKRERKTCRSCLEKSAQRAKVRRQVQYGEQTNTERGRRLCKSCKCIKPLKEFPKCRLSCERCIQKKRERSRKPNECVTAKGDLSVNFVVTDESSSLCLPSGECDKSEVMSWTIFDQNVVEGAPWSLAQAPIE